MTLTAASNLVAETHRERLLAMVSMIGQAPDIRPVNANNTPRATGPGIRRGMAGIRFGHGGELAGNGRCMVGKVPRSRAMSRRVWLWECR